MITLGLIRELKKPADRRVALSPSQCAELKQKLPGIEVLVQSSPDRVFEDKDYRDKGIPVIEDLSDCDVLLGIKEVPFDQLISDKTYLIFSHTIKKQVYNRKMLQAMLQQNIRLIDYECLRYSNGNRVLGFGRYAGWVGTYEAIRTYGKSKELFDLKAAYEYPDFEAVKLELSQIKGFIKNRNVNIAVTGSGRVSAGCVEILRFLEIPMVDPADYLDNVQNGCNFTMLDLQHLYRHKLSLPWNHEHFFVNHSEYVSIFKPYTAVTDILINGIYWSDDMERLFETRQTSDPDFRIRTISDITCDIGGSVPITLRDTPATNPVLGWDPNTMSECEPFTKDCINVVAVSNLPSEIPKDASDGFGEDLLNHVLPEFLLDESDMLDKATICSNGKLGPFYQYLNDFVST